MKSVQTCLTDIPSSQEGKTTWRMATRQTSHCGCCIFRVPVIGFLTMR